MLDLYLNKTQYIVCKRENGTSNGLIGNSVKYRSCPRNCKCERLYKVHCVTTREGVWKADARARRPAIFS
jgi:hypothetical protein